MMDCCLQECEKLSQELSSAKASAAQAAEELSSAKASAARVTEELNQQLAASQKCVRSP